MAGCIMWYFWYNRSRLDYSDMVFALWTWVQDIIDYKITAFMGVNDGDYVAHAKLTHMVLGC